MLAASLPRWRRGVCAGLSLPRAGGGGGRDDDEAESACRVAPCRRRFPPAWPGAGEASGPWPALYSGSGDGAQARASPSPAAALTGSRGARHGGCAFHPSALQPCCWAALVLVSRSAKLGAGEERARSSRVRAANGGGTEKVPAWARGGFREPRRPALLQEVRENGPRTRALARSPSASS